MINIEKGRYWDLPWSLVDGCTPCSPGCDHCWSAGMTYRFSKAAVNGCPLATNRGFTGEIQIHPDRLSIPLKRRKPTVFAVWNDFWHESVTDDFQYKAYGAMIERHTFLILTKRPHIATAYYDEGKHDDLLPRDNIWHGLTICNQPEADEKTSIFLKLPGKKFLSIEPMLGPMRIARYLRDICGSCDKERGGLGCDPGSGCLTTMSPRRIDAVILGGETGPGARPMHPDWVRSVRDQCAAAGVPFFFKQWGEYSPARMETVEGCVNHTNGHYWWEFDPTCKGEMLRIGKAKAGRLLDGRSHDDLPWLSK